jgi:formylglycine-generating enzyme required for sulfatase activity
MKLKPFGKLLLFLIGLGIIATAVYRFVPPEQRDFRSWFSKAKNAVQSKDAPAPASTKPAPAPSRATGAWVTVPAGRFQAGADRAAMEVRAFSLQRLEVTNREYAAFLDECPVGSECGPRDLPSYWDDESYLDTHAEFPVVFVSWRDASAYCRSIGGRLPTSAEWEKAARGTDGRLFPWGDSFDPAQANILGPDRHDEKNRAPKQIATWAVDDPRLAGDASPFGILGMAGNVSEWTASTSPDEPDLMLVAGGSWDSWDYNDGRTTQRLPKAANDRSSSVGFRCAK